MSNSFFNLNILQMFQHEIMSVSIGWIKGSIRYIIRFNIFLKIWIFFWRTRKLKQRWVNNLFQQLSRDGYIRYFIFILVNKLFFFFLSNCCSLRKSINDFVPIEVFSHSMKVNYWEELNGLIIFLLLNSLLVAQKYYQLVNIQTAIWIK